jgi:hypothetical protein
MSTPFNGPFFESAKSLHFGNKGDNDEEDWKAILRIAMGGNDLRRHGEG